MMIINMNQLINILFEKYFKCVVITDTSRLQYEIFDAIRADPRIFQIMPQIIESRDCIKFNTTDEFRLLCKNINNFINTCGYTRDTYIVTRDYNSITQASLLHIAPRYNLIILQEEK